MRCEVRVLGMISRLFGAFTFSLLFYARIPLFSSTSGNPLGDSVVFFCR